MRKREKKEEGQEKVYNKKWGVGKTLAVLFSSVAFIVGVAILGIYLAGGFTEKVNFPQDVSFNEQNNPNYNSDLHRLEITEQTFTLTIGSSTENITAKTVNLSFTNTYAYNSATHEFTNSGWGITETNDGYLENGVIRIPKQVTIGQPFTVEALTYHYLDEENGIDIQQIRGGISTIMATTQNQELSSIYLTIAVDTPVYKTETILVDRDGNEIAVMENASQVIEEEDFSVTTKFYPEESKYIYCNKEKIKTTYYQLKNIQSDITTIYDSASTLHFQADKISEGGIVEGFTAVNAKVQEKIEAEIEQLGIDPSNFETIYNAFINKYSDAKIGEVHSDEINFNVVQASIDSFEVGKAGQTLEIFSDRNLKIFVGSNVSEPYNEFLSIVVRSQNKTILNNILANVALSFSIDGQDPTAGDSSILSLINASGEKVEPIYLNGDNTVGYFLPNNPQLSSDEEWDYNYGYWELKIAPNIGKKKIEVTVSLLLGNSEDGYSLFSKGNNPVQPTLSINVVEHNDDEISWNDTSDKNVTLSYAEGASEPTPALLNLAGLTNVPDGNIYKNIVYFAYFEGVSNEVALNNAIKMFDGAVESSLAGIYQAFGEKYLIPLSISSNNLTIYEVGDFKLYFATVKGLNEDQSLYDIAKIVESPINIHVTKTLYKNSITSGEIYYNEFGQADFVEIEDIKYLPTRTDGNVDRLSISFSIAPDSIQVFTEEFEQGKIQLKIYSNEKDLTSYFIIENGSITQANGQAILSYQLRANSSFSTQEDMAITKICLNYNSNDNEENNLSWEFEEIYNGGAVYLYTPKAEAISLNGWTEKNITINQILGSDGFETVISTGDTLQSLIEKIVSAVVVVDQHNDSKTLANSWNFISDNIALQVSADGKNFTFSSDGEANLGVSCGNVILSEAEKIHFTITAQGITKVEYDSSSDPTLNGADENMASESLTSATINKYGMKGAKLNLNDILKFYIADENGDYQVYNNVTFKLSPTYLVGRSQDELNDLFGENGMITLEPVGNSDVTDVSADTLKNIELQSLTINHNFDTDHSMTFLVSDLNGAVQFTLVLRLLDNVSVSSQTSVGSGTNKIYANTKIDLTSSISYSYPIEQDADGGEVAFPNSLLDGYKDGTYYIIQNEENNKFIISQTYSNEKVVGKILNGKMIFDHFYSDSSKQYTIVFQPEGINQYATSFEISFIVQRNAVFSQKMETVNAFDNGNKNFTDYIVVEQAQGDGSVGVVSYEIVQQNGIQFLQDNGNAEFKVAQEVRFDYGLTSLRQTVRVTLGTAEDNFSQDFTISVVLPAEFWGALKNSFTNNETGLSPTYQKVGQNSINYLVFDAGQSYKILNYNFNNLTYTTTASSTDGDKNLNSYYDVIGSSIFYKGLNTNLLLGLNNQNVYTYLIFENGKKTIEVAQPTIISQIGTTFVLYGNNSVDGKYQENSLANALSDPSTLLENNAYAQITAGQTNTIYIDESDNTLSDESSVGIYKKNGLTLVGIEGAKVGDNLPSDLYKNGYFDGQTGTLILNHLSDVYQNAYFVLSYTLSNGAASQTFNYLFKVAPDIVVKEPNYPYGNSAEYIYQTEPIYLDKAFDDTTTQNGKTRFEITSVEGNTQDLSSLLYTDTIYSVAINGQTYTDPSQWLSYISFEFSKDDSGNILTINLTSLGQNQTIKFVVRRNYSGGNEQGQLSVVGGIIDYTFILNDNSQNHTIRIVDGVERLDNVKEYDWKINNWTQDGADKDETANSVRKNSKNVYLIENWNAGDGSSENIIPNILFFTMSGDADKGENENQYTIAQDGYNFTFTYDNTAGLFTVGYPQYLSQDYNFKATFYTEKGSMATVNFIIYADAQAININSSHKGGQELELSDIFTIKTSIGTSESTSEGSIISTFTKVDMKPSGNIKGFVQLNEENQLDEENQIVEKNQTLQLASVIGESITGDLEFTVTWDNGNYSYTFTIKNFTIEPNLTATAKTFDNQISGSTTQIALQDVLGKGYDATNSTVTLSANSSDSAINQVKWNETNNTLDITFNHVGQKSEVTLPVTISVKSNFAENQTEQTYVVNLTFVIYPSVKITPVYPTPDDEMLNVEYIENNTKFSNFGDDFLDSSAIYANTNRILTSLPVIEDNKVVYYEFSYLSEGGDYNTYDKSVFIKSLTNALVLKGASSTSLKVNDKIEMEDAITFRRGSAGGTSQVVLTISYNNVSIDYTIEISDNLFVFSLNTASNNTSNEIETFYVDKINSQNLLAKNRMIKATLASSAVADDYYIVFAKQNDGGAIIAEQISQVINLSEEFVNLNKLNTIYLDTGLTNLDDLNENTKIYVFTDEVYLLALQDENRGEISIEQYLINEYLSRELYSKLFTSFDLTSRVALTYAGYEVSYDNFKSNFKYEKASLSTSLNVKSSAIGNTQKISSFSYSYQNGGHVNSNTSLNKKTWQKSYTYAPDIDITVATLAGNDGYVTVEVNNTIDVVNDFKVQRKSNGEAITMDEMVSGGANFNLTTDSTNLVGGTGSVRYLGISAIQTDNGQTIYNWQIKGEGADNDGQKVNLTLTYTVNSNGATFTKEFALQVLVLPDYEFDFGGSIQTIESDGIISNQSHPYEIVMTEEKNVVLAGADYIYKEPEGSNNTITEQAYLSVVHKNDATAGEQSVAAFDYSMTTDRRLYDLTYNVPGNITAKLNIDSNTNNWTEKDDVYTWNKSGETLLFENVKVVEFSSQYYILEAVDEYGYKFYLYFTLDSGNEADPSIYISSGSSTISLTEGEQVAFGTRYEQLTVTEEGQASTGVQPLTISSSWGATAANEENAPKVINIQNIEAWGFIEDYTSYPSGNSYFTSGTNANAYTVNNSYSLTSKYLKLPNFMYVTVDKIVYYYEDGQNQIQVGSNNTINKKLASLSTLNNSKGKGTIGGYYDANGSAVKFYLPKIDSDKTWIYGSNDTVQLNMVVTLKYTNPSNNSDVEYFDITQRILLSKTSTISSNASYIADNTSVDLLNYISVKDSEISSEGNSPSGFTIYDDTLAIAVKAGSTAKFALEYTIPAEETNSASQTKTVELEINNLNNNYEKMFYRSISEQFDTVLTSGTIKIIPHDENATFYYNNSRVPNNTITIEDITSEMIRISNKSEIGSNGIFKVDQYYVVQWSVGEGNTAPTKSYRYTHSFDVTGTYQAINYSGNIRTLPLATESDVQVDISKWAQGITYTQVKSDGSGYDTKYLTSYNSDNLYFVVTSGESGGSGTGLASIDARTGLLTLKKGFDINHYVTVQIYQKVSGINGDYSESDINNMQLLSTVVLNPATTKDVSNNQEFQLNTVLPTGTYYDNVNYTVSVPAQTKATLQVLNGSDVVNEIELENDTEESKDQTLSLLDLVAGQEITNYQSLKLNIVDVQNLAVTKMKTDIFAGQTYLVPANTSATLKIYNNQILINTIVMENNDNYEKKITYTIEDLINENEVEDLENLNFVIEEKDTSVTYQNNDSDSYKFTLPRGTDSLLKVINNGETVKEIQLLNDGEEEMTREFSLSDLIDDASATNLQFEILKNNLTIKQQEVRTTGYNITIPAGAKGSIIVYQDGKQIFSQTFENSTENSSTTFYSLTQLCGSSWDGNEENIEIVFTKQNDLTIQQNDTNVSLNTNLIIDSNNKTEGTITINDWQEGEASRLITKSYIIKMQVKSGETTEYILTNSTITFKVEKT